MAESARDPFLRALSHGLVPHALDHGRAQERRQWKGEGNKNRQFPNHTISCLNLFMCFVLSHSEGRRQHREDERVRVRVEAEAVLSVRHVRRSAWRLLFAVRRRQEVGGQGLAPESLLASVPLGPHSGVFTPRFRVPAGRRPRSPRPVRSQSHWAPLHATF